MKNNVKLERMIISFSFLTEQNMNQTFEESKEICEERMKMISNMIKMVLNKSMSWETLESLLNDIASSLSKSKQVNKILIFELKALNSKFNNEMIESDNNAIYKEVVTSESAKINSQEKEVQNNVNLDESAFEKNQEETNESAFIPMSVEEIRNLNVFIKSPEVESTTSLNHHIQLTSQKSEMVLQPYEPVERFNS